MRKSLYSIAKFIGKVDTQTVRIDGGFGSQIICYMQYLTAREQDPSTKCDISFFLHTKSHEMFVSDVTFREWHLDYFNISLDSLKTNEVRKDKYWFDTDFDDKGRQLAYFFERRIKGIEWKGIFPLAKETLLSLKGIGVDIELDYSVIHIRRGDFVKFSSLLITDNEILELILAVRPIITNKVFLISDDHFDVLFETKIQESLDGCNLSFISGGDELVMHALMRNAKILITSNSMFSLSAALLQRKGGISILPKNFFGQKYFVHNNAIKSLSKWSLLSEGPLKF